MIHAFLALLLAGGGTPARFEDAGLRLGPALVTDATLATASDGRLLASRSELESLGEPVAVDLGHGRLLIVEPGLRVRRAGNGLALSAHRGRRVALTLGGERVVLASPASVVSTADGLSLPDAGRVFAVAQAGASPAQDDPDANLRKMLEAAKKAQQPAPPPRRPSAPAARRGPFDWFRTFNPFAVSQPVSPVVVTSSTEVSAVGF